jgi:hypothetical protein
MSFSTALNVTTITTLAGSGKSIFQCWSIPGFAQSGQNGLIGANEIFLGSIANTSYTVVPGHFEGGLHPSPNKQFAVFLEGVVELVLPPETLPIDGDAPYVPVAYSEGGPYGLIIAEDTMEDTKMGHNSIYPSGIETRVMQLPFPGGVLPNHTVIDAFGPCDYAQLANKKRMIDELN